MISANFSHDFYGAFADFSHDFCTNFANFSHEFYLKTYIKPIIIKLIPPNIGARKPTFLDISFPNIIPKYVIIPAVSENIDEDNKTLFLKIK